MSSSSSTSSRPAPQRTSHSSPTIRACFPTLCELTGVPLPKEELHGRSFLPQLLGTRGNPREWVHVQNKVSRHVRDRDYILTDKNQLRPGVETWEPPAKPNQNEYPEKEEAARRKLQAVFDDLGK